MIVSRLLVLCVLFALPASAADTQKPIRLAAPGFTGVNVDEKVATFFSEHFAQKLSLKGISVMSASEVSALVGLERQKQLMGCGEDSSSCMAELANALGAEGIITGSIGKFGSIYQVNIKVLSATNASALSIISKKAYSEEDLLAMLDEAAEIAAYDLKEKLGRTSSSEEPPPERESERSPQQTSESSSPAAPSAPMAQKRPNNLTGWVLGGAWGVYALEYERALGPNLSFYLQPALLASLDEAGDLDALGVELLGGARVYPLGLAPEGLFVGAELKGSLNNYYGVSFGLAGSLGYTFRLAEFLTVSLGGNVGWYLAGGNPVESLFGPLDLSMRGNFGFAF